MSISDGKRKYLAKSFQKTFEFVISILVIGYLVANKLDPAVKLDLFFILGALAAAVVIIVIGVILIPADGGSGKEE